MHTSRKSQPLLLIFDQSTHSVNTSFFDALGTRNIIVSKPETFVQELGAMRPHGVCVITPAALLATPPQWLLDLEQKCFFEGLRVIILLEASPTAVSEFFGDIRIDNFALTRLLPAREIIPFRENATIEEQRVVLQRMAFALALTHESPFDERFSTLLRRKGKAEILCPARISWMSHNMKARLECGVRLRENALCTIHIMAGDQLLRIPAEATSALSTQLRFNFGSALELSLAPEKGLPLLKYLAGDTPENLNIGQGFERALVVVKTPQLREQIGAVLRPVHTEMRVPLVWRNILTDIPRLTPNLVVLEDEILERALERDPGFLDSLCVAAGTQARVVVLGSKAKPLCQRHSDIQSADNLSALAKLLPDLIGKQKGFSSGAPDMSRLWLAANSTRTSCLVSADVDCEFLSEGGIVVRSHHLFRSLANFLIRPPGSTTYFLAKNTQNLLPGDGWRANSPAGASHQMFVAYLNDELSHGLAFREAVQMLAVLPPPVTLFSQTEQKSEQPEEGPSLASRESESVWQANSEEVYPPLSENSVITTTRELKKKKRKWHTLVLVLGLAILLAGVLALAAYDNSRTEAPYSGSFRSIFRKIQQENTTDPAQE